MSRVQVKLELPEDVARRIDPSGADVGRRLLELALLRLVQDGEISSGNAAEILGVPKDEIRRLLREHGVPYFNLTPEELRAQIQASRLAEVQRDA